MKKNAKNGSSQRPRVALLIETSRAYGRDLLMGIAKYLRIHGSWSVEFEEGDFTEELPDWLNRWQWDGVIARVKTPAVARKLKKLKVPVVDVYGGLSGFADAGGNTWTKVSGGSTYTFEESTGLLIAVPEPSTWALLGASLTALVVFRRRRIG